MSFLAAGFLGIAALVVGAVVVLHLISRSRPREMALPTARFIPEGAAPVPTRARRPADLLLLVVRAAIVLLVGAAFAAPVLRAARRGMARVIAVDVSSAAGDSTSRAMLRDSVRGLYRDGDAIVAFDTVARRVASPDSALAGAPSARDASISAGLIAAMRAASELAGRSDSVEIVLISAFRASSIDSATLEIRRAWPGRIRIVRTGGRGEATRRLPVELVAPADDPLRAALALGGGMLDGAVRLVRAAATTEDSAWAGDSVRVLALWPAARSALSPGGTDSAGAVLANGSVVVAPFERGADLPAGRVVARWVDGRPAATEAPHGAGCIRTIGVGLPTAGDLVLRAEFGAFLHELLAPCGGRRDQALASAVILAALAGGGPAARSADLDQAQPADGRTAAWLLVGALALLLLEQVLRGARRETRTFVQERPATASPGIVGGRG